jgi:hypothetical protein
MHSCSFIYLCEWPSIYAFNINGASISRPEAYLKADKNPKNGKPLDIGISGQEPPGNAKDNAGFFEKGVQKAYESDHIRAGSSLEVKAIANGHCHSKHYRAGSVPWI